jgi:hypothetical protein
LPDVFDFLFQLFVLFHKVPKAHACTLYTRISRGTVRTNRQGLTPTPDGEFAAFLK